MEEKNVENTILPQFNRTFSMARMHYRKITPDDMTDGRMSRVIDTCARRTRMLHIICLKVVLQFHTFTNMYEHMARATCIRVCCS